MKRKKETVERRTTATNWEFAGNRSGNDTVVPLSGKVWSMTFRTSTLLGAVEGPTGMIRTWYGGEPWPSIARESSWHWVGTLVNLKVYAEARDGRKRRKIEREIITKIELAPSTTMTELRPDGEDGNVEVVERE